MSAVPRTLTDEERAIATAGLNAPSIHNWVAKFLKEMHSGRGTVVDVGCGTAAVWVQLRDQFDKYIGLDVTKYDGFPADAEFQKCNPNKDPFPVPDGTANAVIAMAVIEFMENPRAFFRGLANLAAPGAPVIVSTPNQLSLLNKLAFFYRGRFAEFSDATFTGVSALLEHDLLRGARDAGLVEAEVFYPGNGRVPCTEWRWPRSCRGKWFSDTVILKARRPLTTSTSSAASTTTETDPATPAG